MSEVLIKEEYISSTYYRIRKMLFDIEQQYNAEHGITQSLYHKKVTIFLDLVNNKIQTDWSQGSDDVTARDYIQVMQFNESVFHVNTNCFAQLTTILTELILLPEQLPIKEFRNTLATRDLLL